MSAVGWIRARGDWTLPADLRWIEVDFPDVLDYKYGLLADEKPRCHVERLSVDLNDRAQRRTMYGRRTRARADGHRRRADVSAGGTVEALAAEVPEQTGVAHWISDITTSAFSKARRRNRKEITRTRPGAGCPCRRADPRMAAHPRLDDRHDAQLHQGHRIRPGTRSAHVWRSARGSASVWQTTPPACTGLRSADHANGAAQRGRHSV